MRTISPAAAAISSLAILILLASTPSASAQFGPPLKLPTFPPAQNAPPATLRFKRFLLVDDQGFKMPFLQGLMPADWTVKGGVRWEMALGPPDLIRIHWGDAQDIRAFDLYPFRRFCWEDPKGKFSRLNVPGHVLSRALVMEPPTDAFDAIDKVMVEIYHRDELKQARVVNKENMPKVAQAATDQLRNAFGASYLVAAWAGRVTFEYELHGQTVQEMVSLVLEESIFKPSGVRAWNITNAMSQRAPKGGFEELKPIGAIVYESIQHNPAWDMRVAALIKRRQEKDAEDQAALFSAIEARIHATNAANDAQHAGYWKHDIEQNRDSENRADVTREVTPWKDDSGNVFKLPTNYDYAWTGADGTIIMSNDARYRPAEDSTLTPTQWSSMERTKN
jgi:hypothetical protein